MRFVSVIVAGRGGIPGLYRGSGRRSAPEWRPPRPRPRCVGPPAAMLRPDVSEMVAQGRLEKARAGWEAKCAGGCSQKIGNNLGTTDTRTRSHAIVGQMMRVNHAYVEHALRIQRDAPELFKQLHAGTITMQAAIKKLDGESDDVQQQEIKAARSEFNQALRNLNRYPDFLKRFRAFMAGFGE